MKTKKLSMELIMQIIAFAIAGSVIYELPYIKYVYYDKLVEAFQITNAQAGLLLSVYAIGCLVLYIPGGIVADKFSAKKMLVLSLFGTGILGIVLAFSMNYTTALIVFFLLALTTSFVFWTALNKGLCLLGGEEDSGLTFGWYHALSAVISFCTALIFWKLYASVEDAHTAMFRTILAMSVSVIIAGIFVILTYKEKNSSNIEDEEKFKLSDVGKAIKNPYLWWASIIMFVIYTVYSNVSYFTPYLSSQIGIDVSDSAFLGVVRGYLLYFLSPLGGYIADKILKSTLKFYGYGFAVLAVLFFVTMRIPAGQDSMTLAVTITMLASAFSMMMYGIMWSILNEIKIPVTYAATAIGLASMLIYLPDLFVPAMFGNWLDRLGEQAGYFRMFLFMGICCAAAVILSFALAKKMKKTEKEGVCKEA